MMPRQQTADCDSPEQVTLS
uniref:Uncharacterized protein n=1 Tax=Anguilla anguilla TaxID=7936 RepID=A0A0E9V162_ANGAN